MDKTVADRIATALKLSPLNRERMAGVCQLPQPNCQQGPQK